MIKQFQCQATIRVDTGQERKVRGGNRSLEAFNSGTGKHQSNEIKAASECSIYATSSNFDTLRQAVNPRFRL